MQANPEIEVKPFRLLFKKYFLGQLVTFAVNIKHAQKSRLPYSGIDCELTLKEHIEGL